MCCSGVLDATRRGRPRWSRDGRLDAVVVMRERMADVEARLREREEEVEDVGDAEDESDGDHH